MRVETGGLIYDDDDKRCTIYVQNTVMGGAIAYIVLLSCFDGSTGGTKWYHGVTKQHFYDLDEHTKRAVMLDIMANGGKAWNLLDRLKSTAEYIEGLYE